MFSEKFNAIFVHIPKTGGQSIESVFIQKHGLTWETRAPLLLRPNNERSKGPNFLAHLFAREYIECGHVEPEKFAAMYKFAVVRNPYDRFISEYRWRRSFTPSRGIPMTMESLLAMKDADPFTDEARHLARQIDFVTDANGRIIVDQILRFDSLAEEVKPIFVKLFGDVPPLEVVNKSAGESLGPDALSPNLRRAIFRHYEADFDMFHYASGFEGG